MCTPRENLRARVSPDRSTQAFEVTDGGRAEAHPPARPRSGPSRHPHAPQGLPRGLNTVSTPGWSPLLPPPRHAVGAPSTAHRPPAVLPPPQEPVPSGPLQRTGTCSRCRTQPRRPFPRTLPGPGSSPHLVHTIMRTFPRGRDVLPCVPSVRRAAGLHKHSWAEHVHESPCGRPLRTGAPGHSQELSCEYEQLSHGLPQTRQLLDKPRLGRLRGLSTSL